MKSTPPSRDSGISLLLKGGIISSDIKSSGNITTKGLEKNGIALSLEIASKNKILNQYTPIGGVSYTHFNDRNTLNIYGGFKHNYKSDSKEYSSYSFFTAGYGIQQWSKDPIADAVNEDNSITSITGAIGAGIVYKQMWDFSLKYEIFDYKTDLSTETQYGKIEENGFYSLSIGVLY